MKVTYLHQYFNTPEMSGGTRSYELARRMVSAGHEVHMITSNRTDVVSDSGWNITSEAGITVHWYPVPYSNRMGYLKRVMAFIRFAMAAKNKALELDTDVIFATSTPLTIAVPAVPASRKKKVPLVFEVRDLWPEMPIALGVLKNPLLVFAAKKLERWAYFNSKAVIALSPGMKEGVIKTGYNSSCVAVIPNSSDNDEFAYSKDAELNFRQQRSWLGDSPLLVYTGTFGKLNGIGYLVDLAVELKKINSRIKVLLVGDGQDRESVLARAEEFGVLGYNLFAEQRIPKKDVPALLSTATFSSSLFIDLPEMQSNSANKFFDSLASGTPVVINYGGWMHDLVRKHQCGLALWQKPLSEVAQILEEKSNDPLWLKVTGAAARTLAEDEFDRNKLAQQVIDVFDVVVNDNSEKVSGIAPGNF